ncbi:hypothetical protein [Aequorivita lipolytica]|uniref:Uncharacterized protein n=1 Tax=Aequorivita lipolytica TaxID=153267 RepID=A0A5C6YLV0_9FLAO|nr:hypothetical protein [Aequorivita lipolytica]TXD67842.1 hypothetical protein ESV24_14820 [Aequorivita lipolytica]SRX54013.1 hypothetical protein AEQU2_03038 [Aequorivita lipolytica]
MNILLFSAFLLILILLIRYFASSDKKSGLKILTIFGIVIGLLALGLNSLFDDSFGASTPVNVQTENLTDKNLKIYAITFWNNNWNGTGNYVTFDKELKPNKKSDFWFENDGTSEFWIVAKNENNEIEYLNIITENESQFDLKIIENQNIDQSKMQIAKELTFKTDKSEQMKRFAFWTNIILIGLLILSLIKIKTGGNTVYN